MMLKVMTLVKTLEKLRTVIVMKVNASEENNVAGQIYFHFFTYNLYF